MNRGFARFDVQVREICSELKQCNDHLIFSAFGVLDLIVEFARPIVPLFARIPDTLRSVKFGSTPQHDYEPHTRRQLDLAWLRMEPKWQRYCDIPIGSVFSCPVLGGSSPEDMTDCVVVCAPKFHYLENRWIVGVILPTVLPHKKRKRKHADAQRDQIDALGSQIDLVDPLRERGVWRFGADRTIFASDLKEEEEDNWNAQRAPDEGLYAVHYVDVHCRHLSYWDSVANSFRLMRSAPQRQLRPVYCPNPAPTAHLFPNHRRSIEFSERIHLLPLEIPYWQAEDAVLNQKKEPPSK